MKNVIKAQVYQIKKDKLIWGVFLLLLFIQYTNMIGEMDFGDLGSACLYAAGNASQMVLYCMMFAGVAVGQICGVDFTDKTTNYELMSGHTRKQVYFGRAVLSILVGVTAVLILSAFPVLIASIQYGWGTAMRLEGVVLRWLLLVFPVFRIVCEMIFMSFLVKNPYVTMFFGFITAMGGVMLTEMFAGNDTVLLGVFNIKMLCSFTSWSSYSIVDGHSLVVYDSAFAAGDVIRTIFGSSVIGMAFLIIGYIYFQKDDLN